MKTAKEFGEYCLSNETGTGFNKKWLDKHFSVIEKNLMNDEEGIVAFVGLKDFISISKHGGNFAHLITNKRIIIAQKGLIKETVVSVSLKNLNDVSLSKGLLMGQIVFDTIKETFSVGVDKNKAQNIFNLVHEAVEI